MDLVKFLGLILITQTLISCASKIEVVTPSSLFILPESRGKLFDNHIKFHHMNGSLLNVDFNAATNKTDLNIHPSSNSFGATGHIGVHEKIDFFMTAGTHAPPLAGLKFQFKGENRRETHQGNISHAAYMAIGSNKYQGASNQNFNLNLQSPDYTFKRTHSKAQMGLLSGYRYEKYILLYLGVGLIVEDVHGSIDYDNTSFDEENLHLQGKHQQITFGWQYDIDQFTLGFEYALQKMKWEKEQFLNRSWNFSLGLNL
jgi:hypothetical protein